ncbi:hypothetical protein [Gudongella sp. SC589]|uniref:hypothetical protein n=1 Tax=Gudongella sp. SC589 TaxID=3385990 RepID=UPI003904B772
MGDVIEVGKFVPCDICKRRQATLLCDMPIMINKSLHRKKPDGTTDYENSFKEYTQTCDREICEKCAIEVNSGIHFCKICYSKLK